MTGGHWPKASSTINVNRRHVYSVELIRTRLWGIFQFYSLRKIILYTYNLKFRNDSDTSISARLAN